MSCALRKDASYQIGCIPTSMQSTVIREDRFLFSELSGLVLAARRWGMVIPFLRYACSGSNCDVSEETFLINTQQWEKHLAFTFYTWLLQKVHSDMKKANDTVNEIMFSLATSL